MHSIAAGLMVLRDRKAHKDPQGQMESQGRQVLPDRKDLLELKALRVQMDQWVHKDRRGRVADSIAGI